MTKETKQALAVVPKGEATILDMGKAKKQNIVIIFFEGYDKEFLDIKGYQLNGPYLIVQEHDDTQFVFPMSTVASLKLYVTE